MDRGYRHRVLALAAAGNFSQFGARLALSPLVPYILLEFDLTKSGVGLLLTGMWVVFALFQFPSGVLADRFGERRVILVAMGATAGCSLLLSLAGGPVLFAGAVVLLGAGTGLYFSVGTSLLSRLYDPRGTALSVHSAGASVAGIIIPVLVTTIATHYGWQRGFLATAGIAGATGFLFLVAVKPTPPTEPDLVLGEQFQLGRVRNLLSRRVVWTSTLLAIVGMFVFQAFTSFFPTFLQEYHGISEELASVLLGVGFGLSALSLPIQGRLSDLYTREVVIVGAFLLTATGFGVVILAETTLVVTVGAAVIGGGMGWAGVVQARIMDGFADRERGTGFGLVRTVFILVGSSGSAVTGVLAEVTGWRVAYGLVVVLLVVAAVGVGLEGRRLRPSI